MLKKLIFVSGWVFLALPTIFNFFKIAGFNFRFYDSYLTGSGYNTYSGLINGLYLTGCFVLLACGYYLVVIGKLKPSWVLVTIALTAAFITVAFGSTDIFYYLGAAKGEILLHINPYLGGFYKLNPFTGDQVMNGGKIMYPPLWLEINKVFWKISESFGWLGQMYFYKLIFLLCHLLTSWIIYKISKIFNSEGGLAKSNLPLLYLLNPLLLFEFAVNAHFDALMLLLIAGGLYLVFRKNTIIGLWLIATSILIKYTAIIFLPFVIGYLLYQAFENKKVKTTLIKIVIAGLASIALAAITFYPYWIKIGPRIFDGISRQSDWFINSVFATFYVPIISIYKAIFGHQIFSVSAKFLWISLILVGLAIFIRYCLKKASHKELVTPFVWLGASGLAVTLFLIFAQRSFWPWYATWALLPVALLKTKDKIWRLTTIFSLSSLAFYIPLAFLGQNSTNILDTWQILYGVVVFAPVLFYLRQI